MKIQDFAKITNLLKTKKIKLEWREHGYYSCWINKISFQEVYNHKHNIAVGGIVKIDGIVVNSYKELKKYVENL
jgi:hypothetical protein